MSSVTKWKLEKAKVKVVFRLQFHATHIPQNGWDKLFVSFVPTDCGKVTAKTTKANVRNGTCKWADPIYETTRLLQDAKTKQYDEKLYRLLVTMGSSRSSLLGEVNINLADYVDALKPTVVSLPLHGSESGAILHVTVQLLTSKTGFREFEQQRELSERGLQTTNKHDGGRVQSSRGTASSHIDKVNSRVKFGPESGELPSLEEGSLNEEYADLVTAFDGSSNTSESLCAEKQDTCSTHEIDSIKSIVSGDAGGVSLSQSPTPLRGASSDNRFVAQGTSDWVDHWGSDTSLDNDLGASYQADSRLRGSLEAAEQSLHELRQEISTLQSHADDISAETQKLTEQLAAEIATGHELAKEVSLLKSECLRFKGDIEWLRNSKIDPSLPGRGTADTDQCHLLHDSGLRWLKSLQILEDKIRELQNKAYVAFQENDCRFLLSDMEGLLTVLQDLKQGTAYVSPLVLAGRSDTGNISDMSLKTDGFVSETSFGVDLCHPEGLLQGLSISGLVSHEGDAVDAASAMQGELFKILRELDESKTEQETLARKMEQMECYYEALIQELEENQKRVLGEYQNLKNEHSTCIYTISAARAQMEAMHQDMNEQTLRLSEERCSLDSLNKELERRAITSEGALRRARLNYSIAVNQLQKDLEVLSLQVLSMYETNENLIRKAFSEAPQPYLPGYPEAMWSEKLDEADANIAKFVVCQNQTTGAKNQNFGGNMLLVDLKKSLFMQEELYQKIEEELCKMLLENIQLEVFVQTLKQTLGEAITGITLEKENLNKIVEQLELSTKSNELLMMKLQTAMDDIGALTEDKASFITKCHDLALQNQDLEAICRNVSDENCFFAQKLAECEAHVTECKAYKSRYEACNADRTELANLVEYLTAEKRNLSIEVSLLNEELSTVKTGFSELASSKENLQKMIDYLHEKLRTLLVSFNEQLDELPACGESMGSEFKDFANVISRFEEIQHAASKKIDQLMKEKKDLEDERDVTQSCLINSKSDVELMKQNFEHDVPGIFHKLDVSNVLLQRLQEDLEVVGGRLELCSEAEAKYAAINEELLSDFARMKAELQELTVKNGHLLHEILAVGSLNEELESSKSVVAELTKDNQDLRVSLQTKTDELVLLVSEVNNLKGDLTSLNDELLVERRCRHGLDCEVSDLTFRLKEKHEELLHFDRQNAEVVHLNKLLLDLESEKSSVCHRLSQTQEHLRKVLEDSCIAKTNLMDMHELLLASDVKLIVVGMQYKSHNQELAWLLESRDRHLEELQKKNLSLETMLKQCLATEANYARENTVLLSTIDNLRSEIEVARTQSEVLENTNGIVGAELEECKKRSALLESRYLEEKSERDFTIEQLRCMLSSCQGDIDTLVLEKEELEIRFLILKAKLEELCLQTDSWGGCNDELIMLQKQYDELNHRLSDQVMKTEEFKNLSVHLRELKDKAEAECLQARQKRDVEGSSAAMQDSLRIAFIKEQYESKLQETRHQLSISKKHGEELLWKLQDALDQLESRKKSEASRIKRNEELSLRILELEAQLHTVLSDNREKVKAYDQIKAELECSLISLECCKEEKQKLVASVQECNEEKSRIETQVNLMREMLEHSTATMVMSTEGNDGCHIAESISAVRQVSIENSTEIAPGHGSRAMDVASVCGSPGNCYPIWLEHGRSFGFQVQNGISAPVFEGERTIPNLGLQSVQDAVALGDAQEISGKILDKECFLHNDVKDRAPIHDQLKAESLKCSMDQLHKELERMKSENSLLSEDSLQFAPNTEVLQRELTHLEKVNEELGNMSSVYNDVSSGGNSIERVLALELELAEALQAKKSSIQFQSSFLRQLSDEAAVLRSFRDINELIKDMLEMKARHNAVEMELKEMHERYSQLSLQFAEVEGERQRLMMTLKTVRGSKKLLSRSSSASLGEPIL
ncbi:hypothetical protein Ancab_036181 [Ancistrocladus abbreviatus]